MKKKCAAAILAAVLAFSLSGCAVTDYLYYLFGGDEFIQEEKEPDYQTVTTDNGITLTYDANAWYAPALAEDAENTVSIVNQGDTFNYTVILLQTDSDYEDFLAQSAAELEEAGGTVKKDVSLAVSGADVQTAAYDCGSYQTLLAEIQFPGSVVYVTAATRLADMDNILTLLETIQPAA